MASFGLILAAISAWRFAKGADIGIVFFIIGTVLALKEYL